MIIQAVTAYFNAFNRHDAEAVRDLFAPNGELRDWNIHAKVCRLQSMWNVRNVHFFQGGNAVREAVGAIFLDVPEINCEILQVHVFPENLVAVAEIKIELGQGQSILVADVIEFDKNSQIISLRAYKG